MNLPIPGTSHKWDHMVFVFLCWLISFTIKFHLPKVSFMLWHVLEFPSFLRLNNILLYVYSTFCWSIHPSVDTPHSWPWWIMLLQTWMNKCLLKALLFILLCIYPEEELLDHMVLLFLIIWGTSKLFSTAAAPFYISKSAQRFWFFHILTNPCYFLFFDNIYFNECEVADSNF